MTPQLTLDDRGYPAVREIHGLAFPITVLTSAVHLDAEQKVDREAHSRRLVTVWNAHQQLVDAVRMLKHDHDITEPHHAHLCPICKAADAALAAATE